MQRYPQRKIIRVDGHRVGLRYWPGEGQPLVLLHGFLDSSEGWDGLCKTTARPCYALDIPGFGRSDIPQQPCMDFYAERLAKAVKSLQLEDATWVGHSMGGAVARRVADGPYQDLVSSLSLITPAGFGRIPLAQWADGPVNRKILTAAFPLLSINPLAVILAYPFQVSGGKQADGDMILRTMRQALRGPQGPSWAVQALASMTGAPEYELLERSSYTGPVRSLWGTRDRLIPAAHSKNLHQVFPQARITVWPDLAHHPQVEQPLRLRKWISMSKSNNSTRPLQAA